MKIVIAPTWEAYKYYCIKNKLSPLSARYVGYPEQLLGLELAAEDVVDLGNPNPVIYEILATRIRTTT